MRKISFLLIVLLLGFSAFSQEKITGKSNTINVKYDLDYQVVENTGADKPTSFLMVSSASASTNPFNFIVKVTDEDGISTVLINGNEAQKNGSEFSGMINLEPNNNTVKVKVIDSKANIKEKSFLVNFESVEYGWKNYALFFAAEDYKMHNTLKNPIDNAEDIGEILENDYNFKVEIIENPDYINVFDKLDEYSKKFTNKQFDQNGQLLIFFSGHGIENYFLPIGANESNLGLLGRTAIQYYILADAINKLQCNHILVMVDACYSKSFEEATKGNVPKSRYNELTQEQFIIENFKNNKTRLFFTSDAEGKETPDNSDMARKFIDALNSKGGSDYILRYSELSDYLKYSKPKVNEGSFKDNQTDADFLFIYNKK
ncbi:MAG: caspase family protein [Bacteroidales bacterium]|nr:caspase family protein [Bacteroidales bacterium]